MSVICLLRQANARTIVIFFWFTAFFNADDLETTLFSHSADGQYL